MTANKWDNLQDYMMNSTKNTIHHQYLGYSAWFWDE